MDIHKAACKGDLSKVEEMIKDSPDLVNAKATDSFNLGRTPLHIAAIYGKKAVAEFLLAKGAEINATEQKGGATPLWWAACHGEKEIVELLLAKGAEVNAKNNKGWTPLDRAVANRKKDVVELLRKHGGQASTNAEPEPTPFAILFGMVVDLIAGVFYFIMSGIVIWGIVFCMRSCQSQ